MTDPSLSSPEITGRPDHVAEQPSSSGWSFSSVPSGYTSVDPGVPSPAPYEAAKHGSSQDIPTTGGAKEHQYPSKLPHGQQWRRPPHSPRRHVLTVWTWELLALSTALGLMAAIVAILAHFHGQRVPEWPFSINLNTLIALLATVFRAALLLVIAEILGQAKWGWFAARPRPLAHLQDFDQSSRSVLGALRLVWLTAIRAGTAAGAIAFAAALVAVMSFAIGPFTQQAIRSMPCEQVMAGVNSSLPKANYVPGTSAYYRIAAGEWEVDVDMKSAMINGLTNTAGNVEVVCPSGNCTFPDYGLGYTHASIAMCGMCVDTTAKVVGPDEGGNLTLPDGAWINLAEDSPYLSTAISNLSFATDLFSPQFSAASATALMNVSILSFSLAPCTNHSGVLDCPHNVTAAGGVGGPVDYVAASCTLYPCLQTYYASISVGQLDEHVVSSTPAPLNLVESDLGVDVEDFNYNYTGLLLPCAIDGGTIYDKNNISSVPHISGRSFANISIDGRNVTVPNECLYKMYGIYGDALSLFMSSTLFGGSCSWDARQGGSLWCYNNWWLSPFYGNENATFAALSSAVDTFSTAVTNKFRSTGSGPDVFREDDLSAAAVQGTVSQTTVCTYLAWKWLLLPGGLAIGCVALLAWVVCRGYTDPEQPVWKGNILPLMFYGLQDPGTRAPPRGMMQLDQVEAEARQTMVRFQTGAGSGFVGAFETPTPIRERNEVRDYDMDSLLRYT